MARDRSPISLDAEKLYIDSNGSIELVEIAKRLNTPEGTIRSWKNRYKWDDKINATLHTTKRNVANKNTKPKKEPKLSVETTIEDEELTEKQRLFCMYYIKNFNATIAYLKAYGCSYNVANTEAFRLLVKPSVKREIARLKQIKRDSIMLDPDDIIERYMRIAFADMTDFVNFGQQEVPVMNMFGPVMLKQVNPITGKEEEIALTQMVNTMKFKEDDIVDGGLICQISTNKQGAKIKLEDRQRALDWLANFFDMNPMNQHKQKYDNARMEIERSRLELEMRKADQLKPPPEGTENDGFIEALNASAKGVWGNEDTETSI